MFQILIGGGIFTSAFLLFFIQLLLAKHMLPQFGGSAFVWVTSILFFQASLLLGYFYAYLIAKLPSFRLQAVIHFALLVTSLYFIPIHLDGFVINNQQWPPFSVWQLLSSIVLLPFIVISASSPLLQYWYCKIKQSEFPYYLYSISNAGSLLGLLGYPLFIETTIGLQLQAQYWTILYLVYCGICLSCMGKLVLSKNIVTYQVVSNEVKWLNASQWIFLSFLSSALLLAITQFLSQNVINLPLMWVIPLGLYLISFIITFAKASGYDRNFWISSFLIFLTLLSWLIYMESMTGYDVVLILFGLLYSTCMICHGELVLRKPSQNALTTFYLLISLGGVLGSLFVNIVAYVLLGKWWDFYIPLTLLTIIVMMLSYQQLKTKLATWETKNISITCVVAIVILTFLNIFKPQVPVLAEKRSLYGFLHIYDSLLPPSASYRTMRSGQIAHGNQFLNAESRNLTTTYYGENSGVYLAIKYLRQQKKQPLNIAVIGLGCGTIASLGIKGDNIDFYELDDNVKEFAYRYFTFLENSLANINVILGDARLSMVKAQFSSSFKKYDLIVADAFNGDAIPFHLLTTEALSLYRNLLTQNGIIAFHTTNTYVNFRPLTKRLAMAHGLTHFWTVTRSQPEKLRFPNHWAMLSADPEFGSWLKQQSGFTLIDKPTDSTTLWTDDFNSILPLLKLRSL